MRISLCAAALAMLELCIAAPSFRSSGNGAMNEQVQPETVDEETLKYFHEPGYVFSWIWWVLDKS
jgi:hypothetical protein